ncbi:hypothetical protein DESC_180036 [Desulfosarcina cetonica]|nr:hypothetical protein DESC_180036 [Desulfosarcina cetonica]
MTKDTRNADIGLFTNPSLLKVTMTHTRTDEDKAHLKTIAARKAARS